jgi:hypothetical protein
MTYLTNEPNGAYFSECQRYRYALWRWWGQGPPRLPYLCAFICLNPSTADASNNDPTVTRCIVFSKRWGFDGFAMLNLFAHRATDPKEMKRAINPVGPLNDDVIRYYAKAAGMTVAAWGAHGTHLGRNNAVLRLLKGQRLYHLAVTKDGHPRHPLYLAGELKPEVWEPKC